MGLGSRLPSRRDEATEEGTKGRRLGSARDRTEEELELLQKEPEEVTRGSQTQGAHPLLRPTARHTIGAR